MADTNPETYRQCAIARLARAQAIYGAINPESRSTAFCELAQVASLIWDGVIDAISIAYITDGGEPSGVSTQVRQYAKAAMPDVYGHWNGPGWLHNFQHRPHQDAGAYDGACRHTANLLMQLNGYLPEPLRLPADSFDWLT